MTFGIVYDFCDICNVEIVNNDPEVEYGKTYCRPCYFLFKEPWRKRIREDYRFASISCKCEKYIALPYYPFCGNCRHAPENHIDYESKCVFMLGQNLIVK